MVCFWQRAMWSAKEISHSKRGIKSLTNWWRSHPMLLTMNCPWSQLPYCSDLCELLGTQIACTRSFSLLAPFALRSLILYLPWWLQLTKYLLSQFVLLNLFIQYKHVEWILDLSVHLLAEGGDTTFSPNTLSSQVWKSELHRQMHSFIAFIQN